MNELTKWDEIQNSIDLVKDLKEIGLMHEQIEAIKIIAKQKNGAIEVINKAQRYKIEIEIKGGEIYKGLENNQGIRKDLTSSDDLTKSNKQQAQQELNKSRETINQWVKLSDIPENKKLLDEYEKISNENKTEMNTTEFIRFTKQKENEKKHNEIIINNNKEFSGLYDVIIIDPPWDIKKIDRDCSPEQTGFDYPVMSLEEIKNFKIPAENDCHLFLWITQKYLPYGFDILNEWGFKYILTFVWHKNGGFQPFNLPQYNCEFILYARKGNPQFINTKDFFTCFNADRTGHSEKPEKFYEILRRVTIGKRIDIFNRREIEGFDRWGNECR